MTEHATVEVARALPGERHAGSDPQEDPGTKFALDGSLPNDPDASDAGSWRDAAESEPDIDADMEDVAEHYEEMTDMGANDEGEGKILSVEQQQGKG